LLAVVFSHNLRIFIDRITITMTTETKVCRTCKEEKPLNDFHFRNDQKIYRPDCKECVRHKERTRKVEHSGITSKVCPICNEEKSLSEFHKRSGRPCGVQSKCKECNSKYKKERYWDNRDVELAKMTKSRLKPENVLQRKGYYEKNKEEYKARYLKYMADEEKKERKKRVGQEYVQKNKEKVSARARAYKQRPEVKKRDSIKHKFRKENDIVYNIKRRLRFRLRGIVKKLADDNIKKDSAIDMLGCTMQEFKEYFESKFTEGMSWDKLHLIHIDHIMPCTAFDLTKEEEQKKCFHYSNLQPLWWKDNLSKGNKIIIQ
jgi:hypothetical protein